MSDLIIGAAGLLITAGLGALSFVQWRISEKTSAKQREAEALERARQRDVGLTEWGFSVISLMAELEAICCPLHNDRQLQKITAETMAWKASSLVDQGRLFFPNVPIQGFKTGLRVKLLDEVLRSCYIARCLAYSENTSQNELLRAHIWSSRVRFVRLLQQQVKPTLQAVNFEHAGDFIDPEPKYWPKPEFIPSTLKQKSFQ